jgi:hypothetical protein
VSWGEVGDEVENLIELTLEEVRIKISSAQKGKKVSEERRLKSIEILNRFNATGNYRKTHEIIHRKASLKTIAKFSTINPIHGDCKKSYDTCYSDPVYTSISASYQE